MIPSTWVLALSFYLFLGWFLANKAVDKGIEAQIFENKQEEATTWLLILFGWVPIIFLTLIFGRSDD